MPEARAIPARSIAKARKRVTGPARRWVKLMPSGVIITRVLVRMELADYGNGTTDFTDDTDLIRLRRDLGCGRSPLLLNPLGWGGLMRRGGKFSVTAGEEGNE